MKRRAFFAAGAGLVIASARAAGQGRANPSTNFAPMDSRAYRNVRLPAKPGATASMDVAGRDALEHRIRCMCGCALDVYTCRTTDFTCPVSPAMHRDILSLIDGGHTADEILAAFETEYGERVYMAPKREGFNWVGYLVPSFAMAAGAVVVTMLLRRWARETRAAAPATLATATAATPVGGTPEEMARLQAAIRDDSDDGE